MEYQFHSSNSLVEVPIQFQKIQIILISPKESKHISYGQKGGLNKFDDYRTVLTKIPSEFQKNHDLAILKF